MSSMLPSTAAGSQPLASPSNHRREVRALHVHLNASTPAGFARVAALFQGLLASQPVQIQGQGQNQVHDLLNPTQALQQIPENEQLHNPAEEAPQEQSPGPETPYCSICRSHGADSRLPCGHTFHDRCVRPWLVSNRRCADLYCTRRSYVAELQAI